MSPLPTVIVAGNLRDAQWYVRLLQEAGDAREFQFILGDRLDRFRGLGRGRDVVMIGPIQMYSSVSRYFEIVDFLRAGGACIEHDDLDRLLGIAR